MAQVLISEGYMTNIADAIRSKLNTTATYTPGEMSSAINLITTPITLQNKSITPTKLTQSITADNGYNGLGTVTINPIPNNYIEPTGTININSNGTIDVTQYASANVSVSGQTINLQGNKIVSSSENNQTINPDSGYNGFSSITITGLGTTYVGSGISRRTSSNLSVDGATVIVLPGYYSTTASKAISSVTQATPTISVNSSTGLITASATQSAGYVSAGTKSATSQMTVKAATTYTPTTANQTIAAGTYLTGIQTIKGDSNLVAGNIKNGVSIFGVTGSYGGSGGITPTGTTSITANGSYDVTNYATASVNVSPNLQVKTNINPTESSQTISPDTNYDGLSSVQINAVSTTYVGSGISRNTSADIIFQNNSNLLDPDSTVINAYTASATGKLTSSSPDRAVIIPVAANTDYIFTWNRIALTSDSDDFSIGIFQTYPVINSVGRWVGASLSSSGSVSKTFSTTNTERYIAIKIAHSTKTDFSQTLATSTLYAINGNVISVPAGYYENEAFTAIPTEEKNITANGTYTPSTGKLISNIVVNVPTSGSGITPAGTLNITANGSNIDVTNYATVNVNVPMISNINITQDQNGYLILNSSDINSNNIVSLNTSGTTTYTNGEIFVLDNNYAAEITRYRLTKSLTYNWDLTNSLIDTISGATITLNGGATQSSQGISINSASQYFTIPVKYAKYMTYEFDIGSMTKGSLSTHGRLIMMTDTEGLIYRNGTTWGAYLNGAWATNSSSTSSDLFAGHTLKMVVSNGNPSFYIDDVLWYTPNRTQSLTNSRNITIGSPSGQGYFDIIITGIRIYEGVQ